jgi:hypothetical protein
MTGRRGTLPVLYTVVWVWLAIDPPSLSGAGDEPATAWAILLAILAGHVLLGYLVGEWWVLWLALVPVATLAVAEGAQWIPLIGMAYAIPAASLLTIGVGTVQFRQDRRTAGRPR